MKSKVTVQKQGNFFDHRNERFAKALNQSLLDIAQLGAKRVKDQLVPNHGFLTGYLRASVHGGLVKNFHAQIDAGQLEKGRNVIYAGWVEGVSTRNKISSFKGYKMFHKTFLWLRTIPSEAKDIMGFNVRKQLN